MSLRPFVTVTCHCAWLCHMSLSHFVTLSQLCHFVPLSQSHVTVLDCVTCHCVALSPCHYITVTLSLFHFVILSHSRDCFFFNWHWSSKHSFFSCFFFAFRIGPLKVRSESVVFAIINCFISEKNRAPFSWLPSLLKWYSRCLPYINMECFRTVRHFRVRGEVTRFHMHGR